MIYVWDNISEEVHPADGLSEPTGINDQGELDTHDRSGWTKESVVDFPDCRVVIESDMRGHLSLWLTTKED